MMETKVDGDKNQEKNKLVAATDGNELVKLTNYVVSV